MKVLEMHICPTTLHCVRPERVADVALREKLLDSAMGADRFLHPSEQLRHKRTPALAYVAEGPLGLSGTIRLWHVRAWGLGFTLLLGPLAIAPPAQRQGIGTLLTQQAIDAARRCGATAIVLEGDPGYYSRFSFSASHASRLSMPGRFERHRLQGLPLVPGSMDRAHGVLKPG
ncbi:MAG: N-acetyltransferase [Proteobacteria bacterium]|nr:N-acetyltransferase [Pseudomonadota bacterium]